MDNKIKIWSVVVIIAILGLGAGMYWKFADSDQKPLDNATSVSPQQNFKKEFTTIRTTNNLASISIIELADKLGYYREEGIVIEYTGIISGGPESIMTVASGTNDVGASAFSAIINAIGKNTKIKVIVPAIGTSPQVPDYKWFVLENSSIKKPADLKGKKIAVNSFGAHAEYVTREYLQRAGLTKDDVQLVVIPYENQEQVLRQRQIDVIAPNGAWVQKIESGGGVRVLFTDGEIIGEMMKTGTFISPDFIEKKPDVVRKFVNATVRAIQWDKQNRNESRILIADIIKAKGGNTKIAEYHIGWGIRDPPVFYDSDIQFWIDWMTEDGVLKPGQLKPSDVYTNEFNPYYKK